MKNSPAAARDAGSLEALLRRLRPKLTHILSVYRIPPSDAEDVLQEVLLAAIRSWDAIENMEAWLAGTLRNRCAAYWKQRRASLLQAVDAGVLEALSAPLPPPQERAALVWDLQTLIESLSDRHREVLWLRFGLGLTHDEVARRLGYCPSSVRKLTGRFLARLRRRVAGGSDPLPGG